MPKSIKWIVVCAALIGAWLLWRPPVAPATGVAMSAPLQPAAVPQRTPVNAASEIAQRQPQDAASGTDVHWAAHEQWTHSVVDWLVLRGDAESLAAAAGSLYSLAVRQAAFGGNNAQTKRILELLQRATALAPGNAPIQWLALSLCQQAQDCDSSYEAALRSIDPKNALGWMGAAGRAAEQNDRLTLQLALQTMGQAERFDLYSGPLIGQVARALEAARVPRPVNDHYRESIVRSLLAVADRPLRALDSIVAACQSPDRTQLLEQQCRRTAQVLQRSDALLARDAGIAMGESLALPDAANARRRWVWLRAQAGQLGITSSRDYLRALQEQGGQVRAIELLLRERGVPLEPPPE